MRLSDADIGGLSGLKYKLICCFKLASDMVRGGIWKFVNDTGGPAFLERELMGSLRLQLMKATILAETLYFIFSPVSFCFSIYRHESVRCVTLPFFLVVGF